MEESHWRERAGSFGAAADVYDRSRPSYPVEAVRWLLPEGATRVLDLGAGTGRLTGLLLDLGMDVVAVEPLEKMRAYIPARAQVLAGSAELLPLPDASVDAVLVGQAFHWFDPELTLPEVARVLRPGGTFGLLWNVKDEIVDWVRELHQLVGWPEHGVGATAPFDAQSGLGAPAHQQFTHVQSLDAALLVDLVSSTSALLTMPVEDRVLLLQQVLALAPADGPFEMPYLTEAWRSVRA